MKKTYFTVRELNKKQLTELKQNYYCEKNKNVSWGELANIDKLVSDKEIFRAFKNTEFVAEDFSC